MQCLLTHKTSRVPWNKGKITGQKPPLKRNEIWAIRVRLQIQRRNRDLALFNLAIDSKLRACDLVRVRVRDVTHGSQVASRAIIMQRKTKRPVQFEITDSDTGGGWQSNRRQKAGATRLPVPQSGESRFASINPAIRQAVEGLGG